MQPLPPYQLRIAQFLVGFFLFVAIVGFEPLRPDSTDVLMTTDGNAPRQVAYLSIFAALLYLAFSARSLQSRTLPIALSVALGWCWLSMTWAIEPSIAVRRLVLTTVVISSCLASVYLLGRPRFLSLLASFLGIVMIFDFVSVFIFSNAIHAFDMTDGTVGGWRGLHIDKNLSGSIAAVSCIVIFFQYLETRQKLLLVYLAFGTAFLIGTGSKTSTALMPLSIVLGLVYRNGYKHPAVRSISLVILLLIAVGIPAATYASWDKIIRVLDDPEAFTGRTQIWNPLLSYIGDNWLLGSGAGSFWNIGPNSPMLTLGGWITDQVAVGHNGYIDIWVQTGIVGFILTLIAASIAPIATLLSLRDQTHIRNNAVALSLIFFGATHNFQETSFFDKDNPVWVATIFAIALIHFRDQERSTSQTASSAHTPHSYSLSEIPNRFRNI